jgi:hypothetical protein
MPTTGELLRDHAADAAFAQRVAQMRSAVPVVQPVVVEPSPALSVPAYAVAFLPAASASPNSVVRVTDNPQGLASSDGVNWISEVDGTNLGPGGMNV